MHCARRELSALRLFLSSACASIQCCADCRARRWLLRGLLRGLSSAAWLLRGLSSAARAVASSAELDAIVLGCDTQLCRAAAEHAQGLCVRAPGPRTCWLRGHQATAPSGKPCQQVWGHGGHGSSLFVHSWCNVAEGVLSREQPSYEMGAGPDERESP